ncbi:hypothetical protein SAMN04490240_3338 [Rhodococcus pyridinivorans]|uniref:hypothetical protein n=1 Tax=Rhodococcus pyridinivorans TaxID=103816 RepID=UPI0007CD77F7|nr:hypothetical protein [Rhodococcus pyridinivorans]QXF80578.1 hypothetical protein HBA53_05470 [Rhodococcus pyridinivorans]SED18548.1 hypothetical protein SAMN04490240_3338 [Rhodococcus pyridinivorans]
MTARDTPANLTEALPAGPRGRRLLLEYAQIADDRTRDGHTQDSFSSGVFYATYRIDVARGTAGVLYGHGADGPLPNISPGDVARRLANVPLPQVTEKDLRTVLAATTDSARYWQEPDGDDILAATEPMRPQLRRIAEHLTASEHTRWWTAGIVRDEQWSLGWVEPHANVPRVGHALATWREKVVTEEKRAARERPTNPTANWSGVWWSTPLGVLCSTRALDDGSPACLRFVEDSGGENHAGARRHFVPDTVDVLEIHGPDDWAQLCRRFPLEVTAQKRHDWYRTTGRDGKWVLPDWRAVAEVYGGVHLTVAGYLAAAGTAIDVDGDTASVIAGWAPDETFWLTDDVHADGDIVDWVRVTNTETWSEA